MSVQVVRAFVRLREILETHKDLARELRELEKKYDAQFKVVFDAIRALMIPPPRLRRRRIGLRVEEGPLYGLRRPRLRRGRGHNSTRTSDHRHAPQAASPAWCPGISGGDPLAVARSVVEIE